MAWFAACAREGPYNIASEGYKINSNLRMPEFTRNLRQTTDRFLRKSYSNHADSAIHVLYSELTMTKRAQRAL